MVFIAETTVNQNWLVPLWLAVPIGLWVLGVVLKLNTKMNKVDNRLDNLTIANRETWTRTHQKFFAGELKLRNQQLNVPDPYHIAPSVPNGPGLREESE